MLSCRQLVRAMAPLVALAGLLATNLPAAGAGTRLSVAFSRDFNVFLTSPAGGDTRTVTTRGTGYQGIWYPWYAWSPDGRYLLLMRWKGTASTGTLLLLNAQGTVLRTLATPPVPTDFWPSWAIDGDQIALVGSQRIDQAYGGFVNQVVQVDLQGHTRRLFSYRSHEGCGGGTPDPAEQRYWQETGFGGDAPRITWSLKQGLAAYTASCAGGVNITDLRTGKTQARPHWVEPALSARGTLAVVGRGNGGEPVSEGPVFLIDPRSGRTLHALPAGELPVWSSDDKTLFFVHRSKVRDLPARIQGSGPISLPVYRSSMMQSNPDGTHVTTLLSADAFAFGPPYSANGGHSLVFSQVENDWNLWRHRSKSGTLPQNAGPYDPRITIVRWDRGGAVHTIVRNGGEPTVRP